MGEIYAHIVSLVLKVYNHKLIYPWFHPIFTVLYGTINSYLRRRVARLGAALAYYTIFSLPAIIIVIIGLVGFFLGEAAVRGEVYANIVDFVGQEAASQIEKAVSNIGTTDTNFWATVLGIGFLIFVATGVFYALQETLNMIFEVREVPQKVKIVQLVINRLLSLGMVLSIGGMLVLSIILNTVLTIVSEYITTNEEWIIRNIPENIAFSKTYIEYFTDSFLILLSFGLSLFSIALFFAMLFRILPAIKLPWRYIWAGSFFSAALFWVGERAMAIYLSNTSVISAYGAAGSLIVVLIWVYYSSQLIFLGAEFIRALTSYREYTIEPKSFAVMLQNVNKNKKVGTANAVGEEIEEIEPIQMLESLDESEIDEEATALETKDSEDTTIVE